MTDDQARWTEASSKLDELNRKADQMEQRIHVMQGSLVTKATGAADDLENRLDKIERSGDIKPEDYMNFSATLEEMEERVNQLEKPPWWTDRDGVRSQRQTALNALSEENTKLVDDHKKITDLLDQGEKKHGEIKRELDGVQSMLGGSTTTVATSAPGAAPVTRSLPGDSGAGATVSNFTQVIGELVKKADVLAQKASSIDTKMASLEQDPASGFSNNLEVSMTNKAETLEGKASSLDARLAELEKAAKEKGMSVAAPQAATDNSEDYARLTEKAAELDKKAEAIEARLNKISALTNEAPAVEAVKTESTSKLTTQISTKSTVSKEQADAQVKNALMTAQNTGDSQKVGSLLVTKADGVAGQAAVVEERLVALQGGGATTTPEQTFREVELTSQQLLDAAGDDQEKLKTLMLQRAASQLDKAKVLEENLQRLPMAEMEATETSFEASDSVVQEYSENRSSRRRSAGGMPSRVPAKSGFKSYSASGSKTSISTPAEQAQVIPDFDFDFDMDFTRKVEIEEECRKLQQRLLMLQTMSGLGSSAGTGIPDPVQAQELQELRVRLEQETSKSGLLVSQLQQRDAELQQKGQEHVLLLGQKDEHIRQKEDDIKNLSVRLEQLSVPRGPDPDQMLLLQQKDQQMQQKDEQIQRLTFDLSSLSTKFEQELSMKTRALPEPAAPQPDQGLALQQMEAQIQELNLKLSTAAEATQQKEFECQELLGRLEATKAEPSQSVTQEQVLLRDRQIQELTAKVSQQGLLVQQTDAEMQQVAGQLQQQGMLVQQKDAEIQQLVAQLQQAPKEDPNQASLIQQLMAQLSENKGVIEQDQRMLQQKETEKIALDTKIIELQTALQKPSQEFLDMSEQLQRAKTTIQELSMESQTLKTTNKGLQEKYIEIEASTKAVRADTEQRVAMETSKVADLNQRSAKLEQALAEQQNSTAQQENFNIELSQRLQAAYEACAASLYRVDNSELDAKTHGMHFRLSKSEENKSSIIVPWGTVVPGSDMGDGWLSVGQFYLPFEVNGARVLSSSVPLGEAADPFETLERLQAFFLDPRKKELDGLLPVAQLGQVQSPQKPPSSPVAVVKAAGGSGQLPIAAQPAVVNQAPVSPGYGVNVVQRAPQPVAMEYAAAPPTMAVEYVTESLQQPAYPMTFAAPAQQPKVISASAPSAVEYVPVTPAAGTYPPVAGAISSLPPSGSIAGAPQRITPARSRLAGGYAMTSGSLSSAAGEMIRPVPAAQVAGIQSASPYAQAIYPSRTVAGGSGTIAAATRPMMYR
mmetsp:Transcript_95545/g.179817  ORF Transcript_95545/g.179817 Transcript_95545/m.179817 type:complete len:1272 (+) Transcript_95545:143-3958(+)